MLFTSLEFGLFFLLFFVGYWRFREKVRFQNILILLASYFFYAYWDWRFLSLILVSSVTDYLVGIKLETDRKHKGWWMALSLLVNLGLLGVFKYYHFFVDSFIDLVSAFGYQLPSSSLSIILPVGISFYTFQTLSYSIDIYRGKVTHTRDFVAFLAYVSFFPQLVAGPIERAGHFLPQFLKKREFDLNQAKDGARQVLWGLFKKVVIADTLAHASSTLIGYSELYHGSEVFLGVFFFMIQLYCDFSGYSDIAIGLGKLLGFRLTTNFRYPFFAPDMLQFWSRWHISLTTWFRDYVYVPIAGSHIVRDRWLMVRAFVMTFTISGLWHGANWTFVLWGLLEGLYQVPVLLVSRFRAKKISPKAAARFKAPLSHYYRVGFNFLLHLLGMVLFVASDLKNAGQLYSSMFSSTLFTIPRYFREELWMLMAFMAFEWLHQHLEYPLKQSWRIPVLRWGLYYGLVLLILYFNTDRQAFIYFQF